MISVELNDEKKEASALAHASFFIDDGQRL